MDSKHCTPEADPRPTERQRRLKLRPAAADDPVYSLGYTVGGRRLSAPRNATDSEDADRERPLEEMRETVPRKMGAAPSLRLVTSEEYDLPSARGKEDSDG